MKSLPSVIFCLILGEVGVKSSIPVALRSADLLQLAVVPSSNPGTAGWFFWTPSRCEMSVLIVEYRCSQCRLSLPRKSLPKHSFWKHFQMYFKKQLKKFHWIWKIAKKKHTLADCTRIFLRCRTLETPSSEPPSIFWWPTRLGRRRIQVPCHEKRLPTYPRSTLHGLWMTMPLWHWKTIENLCFFGICAKFAVLQNFQALKVDLLEETIAALEIMTTHKASLIC